MKAILIKGNFIIKMKTRMLRVLLSIAIIFSSGVSSMAQDDKGSLYQRVDDLLRAGKTAEAEGVLKKYVSENKTDYIAITKLGIMCQNRGDKKTALRLFNDAMKMSPEYPMPYFFLGRLNFLMQDQDEAAYNLGIFREKVTRLEGIGMDEVTKNIYIKDLHYVSEVYFTLKRYDDAKKTIDEVLKLDPKQQDAYYNLGVYYYVYEHNRSMAYKSFTRAAELGPDTETARSSKYAIEFMRTNPDSRFEPDFSFIDQEYRD